MGHFDIGHARHPGDTAPFGDAAGNGGVYIEDVYGARADKIAAAEAGDLTLTRIDWNAARVSPHERQSFELVVPLDRFFQPMDIQIADTAAEFNGVVRSPALIGIAGDHE